MKAICWPRRGRLTFGVLAGVLFAAQANAVPMIFTLSPTESSVSIGVASQIVIGLPPPLGDRTLAIESQVGTRPGVSGATLPDGTLSDGLRTNLAGELLVDAAGGQIEILSERSLFDLAVSGLWLPGLPGDPATAASGNLALSFTDSAIGLEGNAAFRDAVIGASTFAPSPLTDLGGGVQGFTFNFLNFRFPTGVLDWDLGLSGASGSTNLNTVVAGSARVVAGTLEDLGGGQQRISIPYDFDVFVSETNLGTPVPVELTVNVSGEIVAYVPEPGTLLLLGVAGLAVGWTVRRNDAASGRV